MKHIVAIALALFASAAFATGPLNNNEQGQAQGQGQGQAQGQLQGQLQGQGQAQGQTAIGAGLGIGVGFGGAQEQRQSAAAASAANSGSASQAASSNIGNTQGVSFTNVAPAPDKIEIRSVGQAPDILATPTAPCRIAVGVSVGMIGGAVGVGYSVEDEGCTLRENARLLNNLGEKAAALKLMCLDEKVATVLAVCKQ